MITHILSVLCNNSAIDQKTNNISLFNILERLETTISTEKATQKSKDINISINYQLISFWGKENGTEESMDVIIEFIDPNKNIIKNFSKTIEMSSEMKRLRTVLNFSGISVSTTGTYNFIISTKTTEQKSPTIVAQIPLEVIVNTVTNSNRAIS